jgi:hypothetical protein
VEASGWSAARRSAEREPTTRRTTNRPGIEQHELSGRPSVARIARPSAKREESVNPPPQRILIVHDRADLSSTIARTPRIRPRFALLPSNRHRPARRQMIVGRLSLAAIRQGWRPCFHPLLRLPCGPLAESLKVAVLPAQSCYPSLATSSGRGQLSAHSDGVCAVIFSAASRSWATLTGSPIAARCRK